jgi:ubiquinone/menaquinone biosynthesis C-methylase UbiE
MGIVLPKQENLPITGPQDAVSYYFKPLTGWFYRHRLQMALNLMRPQAYQELLDIGCGSGIFLKELSRHCSRLFAIDIHDRLNLVQEMLQKEGSGNKRVILQNASIFNIPFEDSRFDCVTCMSVLEHFTDPLPAIAEIARVAKADADIILGFPAKNHLTDTLFRVLGYEADSIHPSSHTDILRAIAHYLRTDALSVFPPVGPGFFWVGRFRK